ncbi:MAG TPA: DNA topoisomerase (ATP-hydrolyzing) subunit A [Phycisphaerales bacterium]|nr:DNA topoisomerase (ATP-hydrolyzing) subunit A [Phycisphaerales bacterium]
MTDQPNTSIDRSPDDLPQGSPGTGRVLEQDIQRELKDSYLTYAMSTIMDRALPDVRDGLKPSQRRILVAMNDLNLRPNRKHLKCAKIAGNTSGDYHPHGEAIVYPTLVNMAQKWRMRVPLIDPQGNFGSIGGDAPAAMRYTEARLTWAAMDLLADLDKDTVNFRPNYDDRLMEPSVLPGRLPNLLINGGIGIAVGMATSLPPQNPTEVLDSIIRVIDRPEITLDELMQDVVEEGTERGSEGAKEGKAEKKIVRYGIKGPDFPTGGVLHGRKGIIEAYATGRGKVSVRGSCHVEELGKDRQQLVIDEIPYNLVQDNLVEWIVEAVKEEKIQDVSDVRNESGREAQTRIVIELKKGADARVVENQLYEFTPLQATFSIINIALVNNQPRTLSLRELIDCYVEHREDVIRRRTEFLLREAKKRAHLLEGLIYAICDIDEVIRLIRESRTREQAIERLMEKRFRIAATHRHWAALPGRLQERIRAAEPAGGVALTRVQAEAIGNMRLIQLVGLEIEKTTAEYTAVVGEIEGYESLLADRTKVLAIVRADCEEMRTRFASPRLTRIEDTGGDIHVAALIPVEDVAVTISHAGYVKRVPLDTYRQQGRGGRGIRASDTKGEDFIERVFVAGTHDELLCFTDTGRVFGMKVYQIPEMSRTAAGRNIVNLLDLKPGEKTCTYLAIKNFEAGSNFLTFVSKGGIVKRTPLKAYANMRQSGLIAVGLKEGDSLLAVTLTDGNDDLMLVTKMGQAIRFDEQDARDMGRAAAGVKGIELAEGDEVIGVVRVPMRRIVNGEEYTETIDPTMCLLTITDKGYGKRTPIDEYRVQPENGRMRSQSRGGKGRLDINLTEKNGFSVAALGAMPGEDLVVVTKGGQLVRMPADDIRECGRGSQGVRVARLDDGDEVVSAAVVPGEAVDGPAAE